MVVECPSLTTITNDTIVLTKDNIFELHVSTWERTVGTVVDVTCQPGLILEGQKKLTCLAGGKWDADPLPTCNPIPATTTTVPPPGVNGSLVLMIVLIIIMVIVVMVMVIICAALYQSYRRRKRSKFYGDPDYAYSNETISQPYSLTDRQRGDMHMHTININKYEYSPQQERRQHTTDVDVIKSHDNYASRERLNVNEDALNTQVRNNENRDGRINGGVISGVENANAIQERHYTLPAYYKPYRHNPEYSTIYIPLIIGEPPSEVLCTVELQ